MFGAQAVPTVVALAAGQPLSSLQGAQPPEQLRRWVDSLLGATAGKLGGRQVKARAEIRSTPKVAGAGLLDDGDFDAAATAYEAILDAKPGTSRGQGCDPTAGVRKRATAQPADAVARADAAPDDIEAAFAAADVEVLQWNLAAAFDRLIGW